MYFSLSLSLISFLILYFSFLPLTLPFSHIAFLIDYIVDHDPFALHDTAGGRRSLLVVGFFPQKLQKSLSFPFLSIFIIEKGRRIISVSKIIARYLFCCATYIPTVVKAVKCGNVTVAFVLCAG